MPFFDLRDQIFVCLGFFESLTRIDFFKEIEAVGLENYNVEKLEEVLKAQFPDGPPPLIRERMAEDEKEQRQGAEMDATMQGASPILAIEATPVEATTPLPSSPIVVELDMTPQNAEETAREELPPVVMEKQPTTGLDAEGLPPPLPETDSPADASGDASADAPADASADAPADAPVLPM